MGSPRWFLRDTVAIAHSAEEKNELAVRLDLAQRAVKLRGLDAKVCNAGIATTVPHSQRRTDHGQVTDSARTRKNEVGLVEIVRRMQLDECGALGSMHEVRERRSVRRDDETCPAKHRDLLAQRKALHRSLLDAMVREDGRELILVDDLAPSTPCDIAAPSACAA